MTEGDQALSPDEQEKPGQEGREITWEDLARLRVDGEGRLLWDGRIIKVSKSFSLSRWQVVYAVASLVVAAAGVAAAALSAWADWEMVKIERGVEASKREPRQA